MQPIEAIETKPYIFIRVRDRRYRLQRQRAHIILGRTLLGNNKSAQPRLQQPAGASAARILQSREILSLTSKTLRQILVYGKKVAPVADTLSQNIQF